MKLYIGIDLGTSAVKLLLMDETGSIKNIVSKEYPLGFTWMTFLCAISPNPASVFWIAYTGKIWYDKSAKQIIYLMHRFVFFVKTSVLRCFCCF